MSKKKSADKPPKLVWRKSPAGYEWASYRLGTIYRNPHTGRVYLVHLSDKIAAGVANLEDGVKRIDRYLKERMKKATKQSTKNKKK
jgi:hypothetical protein